MKTKQLLFLGLVCLSAQLVKAQATVANATNTTTATSYLGSGATSNFDVLFKRNNINAGLLSTTKTAFGVNALAMPNSVSLGVGTGQFSSGLGFNTYIGQNAGCGLSAITNNVGTNNTFIGFSAGDRNRTATRNTFIGSNSGYGNSMGSNNTAIGFNTIISEGNNNLILGADASSDGSNNTNVGVNSGSGTEGSNNTFLGFNAGYNIHGSGNVLLGYYSGYGGNDNSRNNQLYISNSDTATPLIWGDFSNSQLKLHSKAAIGGSDLVPFGNFPTTSGAVNNVANYNLFVKGGILTEEIRVSLATTWADYVFSKDYKMPTLPELEKQILENGHLPNMPSAKEVKENGIELGEMAKMQQEKIEELTLYIIQINKELQELKAKIKN